MQVVIWIIIILLAIFLIWLLRKWIRRIIFILILLALAFLIYGIFNPSGAARLWYNVRTFPSRVSSWISDKKEFLDYDSYKLNVPSLGDIVGDKSDDNESDSELEKSNKGSKVDSENNSKEDSKKDKEKIKTDSKQDTTESVAVKPVKTANSIKNNDKIFSSSDVVSIVSKYIKDNLDDATDILVTIEYDDKNSPEKIILKTQGKSGSGLHYIDVPRLSVTSISDSLQPSKTSIVTVITGDNEDSNEEVEATVVEETVETEVTHEETVQVETVQAETAQSKNTTKSVETKKSNGLTQSDIRDAEQIFSILF